LEVIVSQLAKQVEAILRQDPRARDSDNILLVHMLQLRGMKLTTEQVKIFCDVSFESITRCRRKIQEEGKYPPSQEVKQGRKTKAENVKHASVNGSFELSEALDNDKEDPSQKRRLVNNGVYIAGSSLNIKTDAPIEQQTKLAELLDWNNGFQ
jgi:hypothetical protein